MNRHLRLLDQTKEGNLLLNGTYNPKLQENLTLESGKKLIKLDLFSDNECQHIINNSKRFGLESLDTYSQKIRQANRLCIIDKKLEEIINIRLNDIIKTLNNLKPFGLGLDGIWIPIGINNCFRISEYNAPSIGFTEHFDNPYCESELVKSVLSIVVYLNQDFDGGQTIIYDQPNQKHISGLTVKEEIKLHGGIDKYQQYIIKPKTGLCIMFNHDLLHKSENILKGTKYILRTDLVYKKIVIEKVLPSIFDKIKYMECNNYFRHAQILELEGYDSNEFYERSLSVRKSNNIGNDMWKVIINYLPKTELLIMTKVCKMFHTIIISQQSIIWNKLNYSKIRTSNTPFIPIIENRKGSQITFKFPHTNFFLQNMEACLRVAVIYTIYLFGNPAEGNGTYIASYDPKTGKILKCCKELLLTCAFYKLPCFGIFFQIHKNSSVLLETDKNIDTLFRIFNENNFMNKKFDRYDNYIDANKIVSDDDFIKYKNNLIKYDKIGYHIFEKHTNKLIETRCCSACGVDRFNRNTTTEIKLNNMIFDFSKQKVDIIQQEKDKYIAEISELKIKPFFHAACRPYDRVLSCESTITYSKFKYIDKIQLSICKKKKYYVETIFNAIEAF